MTWFQSILVVLILIVIFCGAAGWMAVWLDKQYQDDGEDHV